MNKLDSSIESTDNDRNAFGERLTKLRQVLKHQGLDGFVVSHADEHLGEYVPASAERLAWLTGFSGSAGLAVAGAKIGYDPMLISEEGSGTLRRCRPR